MRCRPGIRLASALQLTLAGAACGPMPARPAAIPAAVVEGTGATPCTTDEACPAGDVCRDGACAPYEGTVGDPCWDDLDCSLALRCKAGTCSATIEADPSP